MELFNLSPTILNNIIRYNITKYNIFKDKKILKGETDDPVEEAAFSLKAPLSIDTSPAMRGNST